MIFSEFPNYSLGTISLTKCFTKLYCGVWVSQYIYRNISDILILGIITVYSLLHIPRIKITLGTVLTILFSNLKFKSVILGQF